MFLWRSDSKRQLQPRAKESLAAWSFVRPFGNRAGFILTFTTAGVEEARAPVHEQVEHVLQIGRSGCGEVMVALLGALTGRGDRAVYPCAREAGVPEPRYFIVP